jgi:hypothetical protein
MRPTGGDKGMGWLSGEPDNNVDQSRIRREDLAGWLGKLASGQGISIKKTLRASILDACMMPPDWTSAYRISALLELIREVADGLTEPLDSRIALVALNQFPGIAGATPSDRFSRFGLREAERSGCSTHSPASAQSFARRWHDIRHELAEQVLAEIENRNDSGWTEYSAEGEMLAASDFQPFVVNRLEVTYFIDQGHVCTEATTQRWVSADLNEAGGTSTIDHYRVRARHSGLKDDRAPADTDILPMLNCRPGATTIRPDGWLTTLMYFPEPLRNGESVFFATRVKQRTNLPVHPVASIQITSLGVLKLIMRVQFHPNSVPSSCWVYSGTSVADAEGEHAPNDPDHTKLLRPNDLGYVEYREQNCPPGWFYTVGWEWDS